MDGSEQQPQQQQQQQQQPPPKPPKTAAIKAFAATINDQRSATVARASVRRLDRQGRVSQLLSAMDPKLASGTRWRSEENLCVIQDWRSGVGGLRRRGVPAEPINEESPPMSPTSSLTSAEAASAAGDPPRPKPRRNFANRAGANVRSMIDAFESKSASAASAARPNASAGAAANSKLSASCVNLAKVPTQSRRSSLFDESVYADADSLTTLEENIYDVAGYETRRTASVEDLTAETSEYASVQVKPDRSFTDAGDGNPSVPTLRIHHQLQQQKQELGHHPELISNRRLVQQHVDDTFATFRRLAGVAVPLQQQQPRRPPAGVASSPGSASSADFELGDSDDEDGSRSNVSEEVADRVRRVEQVKQKSEAVLLSGQAAKRSRQDQLFTGCCLISLRVESSELSTDFCHPASFAENDFCKSLPLFCFPDAANIRQRARQRELLEGYLHDCESFSFVLTEQRAVRYYGYCLRYLAADAGDCVEAACIVSCVDSEQLFRGVLAEARLKRERSGRDDAQEFLMSVYSRPLPSAGSFFDVTTTDASSGRVVSRRFHRPASGRMQHVRYAELLTFPGVYNTIMLFGAALHERKIVLVSCNPRLLSQCTQALVALLYPLQWQHTFVPIVPSQLVHIVCSPTPYIVGVMQADLPTVLQEDMEDDVLVMDLDTGRFVRNCGDEKQLLSKKLHRALFRSLDANRQLEAKHSGISDLLIVSTFLRFFAVTVGHYEACVALNGGRRQFNKEAFCSAPKSKGLRSLLKVLIETGNFHIFISDVLDGSAYEANKLTVSSVISDFNEAVRDFREDIEANGGRGLLDSFKTKLRKFFTVTKPELMQQQRIATLSSSYPTRPTNSLRPQQLPQPPVVPRGRQM